MKTRALEILFWIPALGWLILHFFGHLINKNLKVYGDIKWFYIWLLWQPISSAFILMILTQWRAGVL